MWARAVWTENNREEECVVPSIWIDKKSSTVFWPHGSNAKKALENMEIPDHKTWRKFPLVKIKMISGMLCIKVLV